MIKKLYTLSYFLFGFIVMEDSHIIYARPYLVNAFSNSLIKGATEFRGCFAITCQKSVVKPIQVKKTAENIEITSFSTLGDIDIVIYDEWGHSVHHSNVNKIDGNSLSIDICTWRKGKYMIKFTHSGTESFIYGHFAIES